MLISNSIDSKVQSSTNSTTSQQHSTSLPTGTQTLSSDGLPPDSSNGQAASPRQRTSSIAPLESSLSSELINPQLYIDISILREVASLIIFRRRADNSNPIFLGLLNIFAGDYMLAKSIQKGNQEGTNSLDTSTTEIIPPPAQLLAVENYLVSLISYPSSTLQSSKIPNKDILSLLLKQYRRILTIMQWKIGSNQYLSRTDNNSTVKDLKGLDHEVHELLTMIHLLSILCRTHIISYLSYYKTKPNTRSSTNKIPMSSLISKSDSDLSLSQHHHDVLISETMITLETLISSLPPGSKSDMTNLLLEALEQCSNAFLSRYEFLTFKFPSIFSFKPSNELNIVPETIMTENDIHRIILLKRYYHHAITNSLPCVPILEFFHLLCSKLALWKDAEIRLKTIFTIASIEE
jgi:hypothetical protein